jgi:hypothetical protein
MKGSDSYLDIHRYIGTDPGGTSWEGHNKVARKVRISVSDKGSDEREIDQGGNHFRITALYRTVRQYFYETFFKMIIG